MNFSAKKPGNTPERSDSQDTLFSGIIKAALKHNDLESLRVAFESIRASENATSEAYEELASCVHIISSRNRIKCLPGLSNIIASIKDGQSSKALLKEIEAEQAKSKKESMPSNVISLSEFKEKSTSAHYINGSDYVFDTKKPFRAIVALNKIKMGIKRADEITDIEYFQVKELDNKLRLPFPGNQAVAKRMAKMKQEIRDRMTPLAAEEKNDTSFAVTLMNAIKNGDTSAMEDKYEIVVSSEKLESDFRDHLMLDSEESTPKSITDLYAMDMPPAFFARQFREQLESEIDLTDVDYEGDIIDGFDEGDIDLTDVEDDITNAEVSNILASLDEPEVSQATDKADAEIAMFRASLDNPKSSQVEDSTDSEIANFRASLDEQKKADDRQAASIEASRRKPVVKKSRIGFRALLEKGSGLFRIGKGKIAA